MGDQQEIHELRLRLNWMEHELARVSSERENLLKEVTLLRQERYCTSRAVSQLKALFIGDTTGGVPLTRVALRILEKTPS